MNNQPINKAAFFECYSMGRWQVWEFPSARQWLFFVNGEHVATRIWHSMDTIESKTALFNSALNDVIGGFGVSAR